ncbi:MAG: HlyD family efflux transporter periplasmic adaptor subunit [Polyangiaceae bacterium]|nr:HlyD family efflux transporter periplasmic adaptor subunit [Polyangiaceae bacterium]
MIKNGWQVLGVAVLVVAGAPLPGCSRAHAATDEPYQGVVEHDERVIGFEVGGRADAIRVTRGAAVKRGDELARLDDTLQSQAEAVRGDEVAVAEAQVKSVRAGSRAEELRALEARLRAARDAERTAARVLARERGLVERGVSAAARLDELESAASRTRAEREALEQQLRAARSGARPTDIDTAEKRVTLARSARELERKRLERHVLRAPVEGTVTDVHVEAGEVIGAGAPVVSLADTTRPYADVFVAQAALDGIRVGSRATVRVDGVPEALPGTVEYVFPRTEFTPRYLFSERERPNLVVRVRVRIEDPTSRLHAGVPARVQIERGGAAP